MIERAHETGLRVHAWVDITRVSSAVELPLSRDHVIYRHPEWLMVPRALAPDLIKVDSKSPEFLGRLTRYARSQPAGADAVYLSPATPGAIEYTAGAVRELLSRYPLDGIHFDDARYPGSDFDYGRDALSAFRRSVVDGLSSADQTKYDRQLAVEPLIYTEAFPDHWRAFRAGQLTTLVARLRDTVSTVRPGVVVSATVLPDPEQALASRFQDWRAWLGRRSDRCGRPDAVDGRAVRVRRGRGVGARGGRRSSDVGRHRRLGTFGKPRSSPASRRPGASGPAASSFSLTTDSRVQAAAPSTSRKWGVPRSHNKVDAARTLLLRAIARPGFPRGGRRNR